MHQVESGGTPAAHPQSVASSHETSRDYLAQSQVVKQLSADASLTPGSDGAAAEYQRARRDGCDCPPPWIPDTDKDKNRVERCAHYGEAAIRLFRHADVPRLICVEVRPEPTKTVGLPEIFMDRGQAHAAFEREELRLLGREVDA